MDSPQSGVNAGLSRRDFTRTLFAVGAWAGVARLTAASAATASAAQPADPAVAPKNGAGQIGFGIGTYGMKGMTTEAALSLIAETGYDGVELALMSGWSTDPANLSPGDVKALRTLLADKGLAVPALLESLQITGTATGRATNLERLKRAVALAHDLAPDHPPVIDTVLGGKEAEWEKVKAGFVDDLKGWAKVAEDAQVTVCFKPHAGNAVQSPERALWLMEQVGSPRIRIIYDYSHFQVEGFGLEDSLKRLLPYAPFISVKDATGTPDKHTYLLPGDGTIDYPAYFALLKRVGYRGFISVEVSANVFQKPGYDAIAATKLCYQRLAPLMAQAGIR